MIRYRALAVLAGAAVVASCGERNPAQDIAAPIAGAAVRFFNFGVGTPAVNFYANDTKLSAGSSASCSSAVNGKTTDSTCLSSGKESTAGTAYGAAASGGGMYSSIASGSYALSGRLATDPATSVSNTPVTIEAGKFYSYYLSGIYDAGSKTVDAFVVEDPFPPTDVDYANAQIRFVNAISNANPMIMYVTPDSATYTAIGGAVAYKAAGAFVTIPPGLYTVSTRYNGSNTDVISRVGVSFSGGRIYTITARGDITVASGTNKPVLDNTANR